MALRMEYVPTYHHKRDIWYQRPGGPKRLPGLGSLVFDHQMTRHRVLLDRLLAHVLAETTPLDPAVRRLGRDGQMIVHPGHAHVEPVGDAQRPRHVGGPDRGGQAVGGVVGQPDRLVLTVERQSHKNRTKKLTLHDFALLAGAGDQGRRIVEAGTVERGAAAEHRGSGRDRPLHGAVHAGPVLRGDQRADVGGRVPGVAHRDLLQRRAQRLDGLAVHVTGDVDAGRRGAVLARVVGRAHRHAPGHLGQVRVGEDQGRRLAAELQVDPLQRTRGPAHDGAAGLGGAGDAHHVHPGVGDQGLPHLGVAEDDLEQPLRRPCTGEQLGQP